MMIISIFLIIIKIFVLSIKMGRIGGVMLCGRSWVRAPLWVKPKTIKLVFVASPLSKDRQHNGQKNDTIRSIVKDRITNPLARQTSVTRRTECSLKK
jgi:hypothetical protein